MTYSQDAYHECVTVVSAHDVAREVRRRLPGAGTVKVHKLLYFAQGLHLGLTGEPIFAERIEAWTMGPVVADLWHDENKDRPISDPMPLSDSAISVIDEVVRRFQNSTGPELIRLTHTDGGPWCQVTETDDEFLATQSRPITTDMMRTWFEHDDVVVAHQIAARKIRERRRELEGLPSGASGLLEALELMSKGEVFCESRPT